MVLSKMEKKVLIRLIGAVLLAEGLVRILDTYFPLTPIIYAVAGLAVILSVY